LKEVTQSSERLSKSAILGALSFFAISAALSMTFLVSLPLIATAQIIIIAGIVCFFAINANGWSARIAATFGWFCSMLLALSLLWSTGPFTVLDTYYAVISWLIALSLAAMCARLPATSPKSAWRALAWTWAVAGAAICGVTGYSQNLPFPFAIGMIAVVILLFVLKRAFPLPRPIVLIVNTVILFLVFLPVVDLILPPVAQVDLDSQIPPDGYSYAQAKTHRRSFAIWWRKYLEQYNKLMRDLFIADPSGKLPYLVRTNASTTFFESKVQINSLGFRGKEISFEKNGVYRIVALGESTTFGFTLTPQHQPWPEVLENLIREKLALRYRVEIINAGLPHHNLRNNLYRLQTKILALKPDMIISYHGWNGFSWLWTSLPPVFEKHLPNYKRRPSRLLAKCEYNIRLLWFKRRLASKPAGPPPSISKLLASEYANAYRDLIAIGRTNNIRLVLGTSSLAVTRSSDPAVIEFYRQVFPGIYPFIDVNGLHSMLVEELARQNPDVRLIDTHPHLDGDNEKFIDLVHFAPQGDRQLAETFFEGIKDMLSVDLAGATPQK
jgi:lysophospholipase L1-like esterase